MWKNSDKAAGPDRICSAILNPPTDVVALSIESFFNLSLLQRRILEDWRLAEVVPIHRGGQHDRTENYRPVSLLSIVLKVMKKCIRDELAQHQIQHNLIWPHRHGVVKGKSCLTNLLFLDKVTERLDQGDRVEVCYFDSVSHRLFLTKLITINVDVINWIHDYLINRSLYARVDDVRY